MKDVGVTAIAEVGHMSKTSRCSIAGNFLRVDDPEKSGGELYEEVAYIPLREIKDITTFHQRNEREVRILIRLMDGTEMDFYYSPEEAGRVVASLLYAPETPPAA